MQKTIAIIDYGMGNLGSVANALEHLGRHAEMTDSPKGVKKADVIILPGVGAFGEAMANLKELKLVDELTRQVVGNKKPFLGICLGMQLIGRGSEEFGFHEGLGWIDAPVVRLTTQNGLRLPHMGWSDVEWRSGSILSEGIGYDHNFYFVHNFHLDCSEKYIEGSCEYGVRFAAAVRKDNIFATQFHPEKSHENGLNLLKNFLRYVDPV